MTDNQRMYYQTLVDSGKFNDDQLAQIYAGLEEGLDVTQFAMEDNDMTQMYVIRQAMKAGADISVIAKNNLDGMQMKVLLDGMLLGFDMRELAESHISYKCMNVVLDAYKENLSREKISRLIQVAKKGYDPNQLKVFKTGLKFDLDINWIDNQGYNHLQMTQIITGLAQNVPVSMYARADIPDKNMQVIREIYLDKKFDITSILNPAELDYKQICHYANAHFNGIDIGEFLPYGFSAEQLEWLIYGKLKNLNIDIYKNIKFNPKQMAWIVYGEEHGLEVHWFAHPKFSDKQMKEICLGLEDGLEVASFAKANIPPEEMNGRRLKLKAEKEADETRTILEKAEERRVSV